MSNYTPGPWKAVHRGKHWNNPSVENYEIWWSEDGELVVDQVYEEADAHLIAAAPELLEALKNLYAMVLGECPSLLRDDHHDDMIRSAIAKAEGRQ